MSEFKTGMGAKKSGVSGAAGAISGDNGAPHRDWRNQGHEIQTVLIKTLRIQPNLKIAVGLILILLVVEFTNPPFFAFGEDLCC